MKTNDLSKVCDVELKSEFIFGHGYALYYPLDYVIHSSSKRFVLTELCKTLHLLKSRSIEA